jgi:hypothetical protein
MSWESVATGAITATAALGGTVVGAFVTISVKRAEFRHSLLKEEIAKRERIYAAFLEVLQEILIKKGHGEILQFGDLRSASIQYSTIRLVASAAVKEAAKSTAHRMTELVAGRVDVVETADFSNAARDELDNLRQELSELGSHGPIRRFLRAWQDL